MQKITFRKLAGEKYIYPELQGHFIEFLGSCIYDGIWVGEDSEIPNYHGIRKDLVDAFQKLHPPVIRWPGGCFADVYHWRNGIGPREQRPVTYNENFGTFETDPNQSGTHEMMEFCEMIGAKPWFNINMMTGSPSEMREWMEYCNRKEPTALSQERKTNGHENQSGRDSAKCPATLYVEELRGSQPANDRPQRRADQNRDLQLLFHQTRPLHRRGRPLSLPSPGS